MHNLQMWLTFIVPLVVMLILIWKKVEPIFFLFVAAVVAAVISGMPLGTAASAISSSFGEMLKVAGMVLLFGTIYAQFLSESGGIVSLANALVKRVGEKGSVVAIFILGYVLCIPVNVIPAAAMASPLIRNLSNQTKVARPAYATAFAVPAYLTTCAVVPTLTATVLVTMSGVDMGWFMIYAFLVTIPIAIVGCLLYALFLAKKYGKVERKEDFEAAGNAVVEEKRNLPPVSVIVVLLLVPIVLIVLGALIPYMAPNAAWLNNLFGMIGNPSFALFIGILLEMICLKEYLPLPGMKVFMNGVNNSVATLVVVGVSGGLGTILSECGFGAMLTEYVATWAIPLLLLTWILCSIFHMGIGIYLVVCTTLYPILAPAVAAAGVSPVLFVLMMAVAGIGFLIPTDSAFWIFKEGIGLSTKETFISITVPGTICSVLGLILIVILNMFSGSLPGLF